ncbi:MAG: hypothetical protein IIC66_13140 [candidate division Zixibacteria bacterium]|nr:hypothetical protein [candidate division Zixibacteria bacterium]
MSEEKKKQVRFPVAKKTYWHLYSLQNLESEKLVKVVNKILSREYNLVK